MVKTQVQIPDHLYREAKRVAQQYEMSFAEVVRRGLERLVPCYPPRLEPERGGGLPVLDLGLTGDPFADPEWRSRLHEKAAEIAEPAAPRQRPGKRGSSR